MNIDIFKRMAIAQLKTEAFLEEQRREMTTWLESATANDRAEFVGFHASVHELITRSVGIFANAREVCIAVDKFFPPRTLALSVHYNPTTLTAELRDEVGRIVATYTDTPDGAASTSSPKYRALYLLRDSLRFDHQEEMRALDRAVNKAFDEKPGPKP